MRTILNYETPSQVDGVSCYHKNMKSQLMVEAKHWQTRQVIDCAIRDNAAEAVKTAEEMLKREPRNEIRIRPYNGH